MSGRIEIEVISGSEQDTPASANPPVQPRSVDDDDFGIDLDYDEDIEKAIQALEASQQVPTTPGQDLNISEDVVDIEDLAMDVQREERLSPFAEFRRKGFLSVSDLVGTVWCEVQYDYRLRTMPYLPPSQRPDVIKSTTGKEIIVDKVKVEDKERILRRGNTIHKRLEREIHPVEIRVTATTREDVWGLRFLNMLSALDALINIGTCRELPVVGFVNGIMIMGIIDEIVRKPVQSSSNPPTPEKRSSLRQANLTSFFSPTKGKPPVEAEKRPRTHRLYVSDSKTRANGILPRESDTLAGRLQVMLYKELLDTILLASGSRHETARKALSTDPGLDGSPSRTDEASSSSHPISILPTNTPFSFAKVFDHLSLDPTADLSDEFIAQSRSIIDGNGLKYGAQDARCLNDLVGVWDQYVDALGLGTPLSPLDAPEIRSPSLSQKAKGKRKAMEGDDTPDPNAGRTEAELALVYRRAGAVKRNRAKNRKADKVDKRKGKRRGRRKSLDAETVKDEPSPVVIDLVDSDIEAIPDDTEQIDEREANATESMLSGEAEEARILRLATEESMIAFNKRNTEEAVTMDSEKKQIDPSSNSRNVPIPHSDDTVEYWEGPKRSSSEEREEEELAWAVEMSLGGLDEGLTLGNEGEGVILRASQKVAEESRQDTEVEDMDEKPPPSSPPSKPGTTSGSIIGKHRFRHDPKLLSEHLKSVLQFWMGTREPKGVNLEEAGRCAWCEFENDCEWRSKKAKEAWEAMESRRLKRD